MVAIFFLLFFSVLLLLVSYRLLLLLVAWVTGGHVVLRVADLEVGVDTSSHHPPLAGHGLEDVVVVSGYLVWLWGEERAEEGLVRLLPLAVAGTPVLKPDL